MIKTTNVTELAFWLQQIGIVVETVEEINVLNKTGLFEEECGKEVLWGAPTPGSHGGMQSWRWKVKHWLGENKGNEHKLTIIWVI